METSSLKARFYAYYPKAYLEQLKTCDPLIEDRLYQAFVKGPDIVKHAPQPSLGQRAALSRGIARELATSSAF